MAHFTVERHAKIGPADIIKIEEENPFNLSYGEVIKSVIAQYLAAL